MNKIKWPNNHKFIFTGFSLKELDHGQLPFMKLFVSVFFKTLEVNISNQ